MRECDTPTFSVSAPRPPFHHLRSYCRPPVPRYRNRSYLCGPHATSDKRHRTSTHDHGWGGRGRARSRGRRPRRATRAHERFIFFSHTQTALTVVRIHMLNPIPLWMCINVQYINGIGSCNLEISAKEYSNRWSLECGGAWTRLTSG